MTEAYSPFEMTSRWQERWRDEDVFAAKILRDKPRFYCYEYPPFPSGSLHMGHVRNYTIGDSIARYKRLRGYNVLYAQAFDSLGLPVEDAAVDSGKTPAEWLDECIANMTRELLRLGLSYDRARFFSYHEPEYYKWTQWIFLKLYEGGAIYRSENWVDWCEVCQTALAFEQVSGGCCWRCGTQTSKKKQTQWYIDVHSIAQDLLKGLEKFDFPEKAKIQQRNWIGCSEGLYISFGIEGFEQALEVFTTRVSVIYGTTFLGLAPEHPLLNGLLRGMPDEEQLLEAVRNMCTIPRVERMKTPGREGLFLNRYAIHPLTGERIPLYVAPFVQEGLGSGAVLGCPAHDRNGFEFARTMGIPMVSVIEPEGGGPASSNEANLAEGRLVGSGPYNGMDSAAAEDEIAAELIRRSAARKGETFRVRDWCISRQRYWSAPIPIVHCAGCGPVPVAEAELPVVLPTAGVDMNSPGNPLEFHEAFVSTSCPRCGAAARRETSTLDTFVNSSWSYMRYCNPRYAEAMCDPEAVDYWIPCDFDIGGTENVTVANFYFRVVLTWLHRLGLSKESEPFKSSVFHGMVLKDGRKMSKSLGNVVQPADLIEQYGVDAVRFQSMWAARPDNDYNWSDEKVASSRRFLSGVWCTSLEIIAAVGKDERPEFGLDITTNAGKQFARSLGIAVGKIEEAYDAFEFQAVCNDLILLLEKTKKFWNRAQRNLTPENRELLRRGVHDLLIMLNPIAPHITEELWSRFGNQEMLAQKAHWTHLEKTARAQSL
ncbi:MAG TPA: leucine--tRNA ligase [Bryobacteraceae bacterium]|jgi:leucyl-tRNA synthetase|nr:leucine--tRNA ligase [Bryobacteraceae bacterium]